MNSGVLFVLKMMIVRGLLLFLLLLFGNRIFLVVCCFALGFVGRDCFVMSLDLMKSSEGFDLERSFAD